MITARQRVKLDRLILAYAVAMASAGLDPDPVDDKPFIQQEHAAKRALDRYIASITHGAS